MGEETGGAGSIISALISAGGSLAGSALSRGGSRRAIDRQNEYNKPINQIARLKEAGLPYAAFANTTAGQQSQVQPYTESGLGEGIKGGIERYFMTTMQAKQIELLDAQIKATEAQAAKTGEEGQKVANENQLFTMDPTQGEPVSYGARMNKFQFEIREMERNMMENNNEIKRLDNKLQKELYQDGTIEKTSRLELEGLVNAVAGSAQNVNKGKAVDTIIERMSKNGLTLIEAITLALAMSQIGSGAIHFPNMSRSTHTRGETYQNIHIHNPNND